MKKFLLYFNIYVLLFLNLRVYFNQQFPYTHDGENHLVRFANYKLAIKQGQFPPRFAPNVNNGYGAPVFNYNYPLANILSLPFSYLKINYQTTFKILVIVFLLMGILSINKIFHLFDFNDEERFLGINIFLLSPYLINLIYFRGNIGEILAINLFIVVFYFLLKFQKFKEITKKDRCLLIFYLVLFFHSHNITALLGFFILLLWVVIAYFNKWKKIGFILSHFVIALMMTSWFYLPAIFEKNLVLLDKVNINNSFGQHLPRLSQLLFSPLEFGFSYISSVDSLSFSLNYLNVFLLVLFFSYFLVSLWQKQIIKEKFFLFSFFTCLFLFFCQLALSSNFATNFFLKFIQFPWRLSLFFIVLSLFPAIFIYQKVQLFWQKIIVVVIFVQTFFLTSLKPADFFSKTNFDYEQSVISTTTQNETNATTFIYRDIGNNPRTPFFLNLPESFANFKIEVYNGSYRKYQVVASSSAIVIEPTMNFFGWETKINGKKTNYLNNEIIAGRLAFEVPKGSWTIETKFTQKTISRLVGNFISLFTLIVYLSFCFYEKRRN